VDAGAHFDADRGQRFAEGGRGLDGPGGAVERGEEPVAGCVQLPAREPGELASDDRVVTLKQLAPVGTRTAARTSLTSSSIAVRNAVRAAPGLRLRRMCPTNQSRKASSAAIGPAHSRASRSR
jgi:hypothetical protein